MSMQKKWRPAVRRIKGRLFAQREENPPAREFIYQHMIDFANEGPEPNDPTKDVFEILGLDLRDAAHAHKLVVAAFESLAESGTLRRATETELNRHLEAQANQLIYELHGEMLSSWISHGSEGAAPYCAYVIAT